MIGFRASTQTNIQKVEKAEEKGSYNSLRHWAFSLRKAAVKSIKKRKGASAAGQPPHTRGRGRKNLRGSIFVAQDEDSALIGPRHSWVGEAGAAHEFGKEYKGNTFDQRPFMEPALAETTPRAADHWRGTIGE